MIQSEIIKQAEIAFLGALPILVAAGIGWFFKIAYEKHRAKKLALARFERTFALNASWLRDNFNFIKEWKSAIEQNRPYSFSFRSFSVSNEDTYNLSDLKLIKEILSLNYKLDSTNLDLNNIYTRYWDSIIRIDSIPEEERREANLNHFHDNFKQVLGKIEQNYAPLRSDLINTVAYIREADRVRRYSFFGCLSLLFEDVFPKINKEKIEIQKLILKENLEQIEQEEK